MNLKLDKIDYYSLDKNIKDKENHKIRINVRGGPHKELLSSAQQIC